MSLKKRLEATSIVDIIYGGIEGSNASDLDKLLQKVEVARQYGEPERALELLAAAIAKTLKPRGLLPNVLRL